LFNRFLALSLGESHSSEFDSAIHFAETKPIIAGPYESLGNVLSHQLESSASPAESCPPEIADHNEFGIRT
jgi:hypothetical protein